MIARQITLSIPYNYNYRFVWANVKCHIGECDKHMIFELWRFIRDQSVRKIVFFFCLKWERKEQIGWHSVFFSVARRHLVFWAQCFNSKIAVIWWFSMLALTLSHSLSLSLFFAMNTKIFSCQFMRVCGVHMWALYFVSRNVCAAVSPFHSFAYFCARLLFVWKVITIGLLKIISHTAFHTKNTVCI